MSGAGGGTVGGGGSGGVVAESGELRLFAAISGTTGGGDRGSQRRGMDVIGGLGDRL